MSLIIKKKKINELLIMAFVFISVVFPGDIFNMKKIIFIVILFLNAKLIFKSIVSKRNTIIRFFGFVFPTLLFLYSTMMTENISLAFSRSFAPYLFLVVVVIEVYELNFEEILLKTIRIIIIATIILVILDLLGFINVNTGFFRDQIMYGQGLGLMGKSPSYPFYYKIFFRTSPLMVLYLFKKFNESKYLAACLTVLALLLSGTRANVLFSLFFLITFYVFSTRNKSKTLKFLFVVTMIMGLLFMMEPLTRFFNEAFIVKGEISDTVRQGHIDGLKELVKGDPWIVLRGSGMGSEFYSYGTSSYVSSIEWSYIDLWRQMGLLFFLLFLVFIILPLFYGQKIEKYKKYAYVTYLCIAATNPLLFSSTSYLVFIYMYNDSLKLRKLKY